MQLLRDLFWKNVTIPEQKTCEHIPAFLQEYYLDL